VEYKLDFPSRTSSSHYPSAPCVSNPLLYLSFSGKNCSFPRNYDHNKFQTAMNGKAMPASCAHLIDYIIIYSLSQNQLLLYE
jgi:hypothetical protein